MINFTSLSAEDVKNALVNIKQVTFEVTDACNLCCKYCGYGEFYSGYDERKAQNLSFDQAKNIIDYLFKLWSSTPSMSQKTRTYISFYGGEPLLNMDLITQCIEYIENKKINRLFKYSMTTNAILLDRHMAYLVDKDFNILISLDGDKQGHSYRVNHQGKNSFDTVFRNVKLLQEQYPDFFATNVNFNSVLHNRNSVESTHNFIKTEFDKQPTISELNNSGIRADKIKEFTNTYRNKIESLYSSENYEKLSEDMFMLEPTTNDLLIYLHQYSGNVFKDYNQLFIDVDNLPQIPTGTCIPFSKKMFVTVNGKILQCERIDHSFALGQVSTDSVDLDFEQIAQRFNSYTDKLKHQCETCYRQKSCIQCIYYIENINDVKPVCHGFMNKTTFADYSSYCLNHLVRHPHLYKKLMTDILVN